MDGVVTVASVAAAVRWVFGAVYPCPLGSTRSSMVTAATGRLRRETLYTTGAPAADISRALLLTATPAWSLSSTVASTVTSAAMEAFLVFTVEARGRKKGHM